MTVAVPALEALCGRFSGFGADRIVPEQAAAIDALAWIAGADAAQALARLIARSVVQGPCLQRAVTAAACLGAKLPAATVLKLLRHSDPQIRADACRFAQASPEMVVQLRDLLDDLQRPVRMAAACALGLVDATRFARSSPAIFERNRRRSSSMPSLRSPTRSASSCSGGLPAPCLTFRRQRSTPWVRLTIHARRESLPKSASPPTTGNS